MKRKKIYTGLIFIVSLSLILATYTVISKPNKKIGQKNKIIVSKIEKLEKECVLDQNCLTDLLIKNLREKGLDNTLILLKEVEENYKDKVSCHDLSHKVGEQAYNLYPKESLNLRDPICSSGLEHGILTSATDTLDERSYIDFLTSYCESETDGLKTGCIHGLGHVFKQKNLDKKKASEICRDVAKELYKTSNLKDDILMKSKIDFEGNCFDGYVMEEVRDKTDLIFEDYKKYCSGLLGASKEFCIFEYQRTYANKTKKLNDKEIALLKIKKYCLEVENTQLRVSCAFSLGEAISENISGEYKLSSGQDNPNQKNKFIKKIDTHCQGDELFIESCLDGVLSKASNYKITNKDELVNICQAIRFKKYIDYCKSSIPYL